jgi:hypothetical protein
METAADLPAILRAVKKADIDTEGAMSIVSALREREVEETCKITATTKRLAESFDELEKRGISSYAKGSAFDSSNG